MGVDRVVEASQFRRADRLEGVIATCARERTDELGREDLAAERGLAETARLDDGDAEVVVAVDVGLTHGDTDAHEQGFLRRPVPHVEALLHRHRGIERTTDPVERDHEPVTEVLDLPTVVGRDRITQQREVFEAEFFGAIPGRRGSAVPWTPPGP